MSHFRVPNFDLYSPFFKNSFHGASSFGAPYFYAREVIQTSRKLDTNLGGETAAGGELVTLALADLHPFSKHPYKVRDDEATRDMAESVKQYGVLSPAIARPMPGGGYELVSGHRRKRACELAGLETMPVIVRELDDDAAAILVVDSNLQREGLFPRERALAYKLKLDALRHQGERTDLTSRQLVGKLEEQIRLEKAPEKAGDKSSAISVSQS